MSTFNCKMCGGALEIQSNATVVTCDYCGTQQTLPKLTDEKRANLYDRANHFRRNNDFDKAMAIYEQILNEDQTDAEAYWSLVLCQYGIEYVEDPLSHRRIPTVNRAQFTSIFDDDNYKSALKYADMYQRRIYEEEAKAINEIQKGILSISQKEEPFDVFICYKETGADGRRTQDSVLAQDLYYQLTQEGFKVFFARITLEDKLGSAYEPYIFAALNSAKVMVVLGTKPEHFSAVWVKNEWSRYLALVKKSKGQKMLIPAYRGMDPYDLPEEFSHLQAQDMSKLGFMQDLIRGIKKILGRDKKPEATVTERVVIQSDGHAQETAPLLRRAFLFLEDGEFDHADEYAEKVLDIDPECAEAYIVKLLIELRLRKVSDLPQCKNPISSSHNYQKAIRFASPKYRETIEGYNNAIINRNETARKDSIYASGVEAMRYRRFDEAVEFFQRIPNYKDSAQKIEDCKKLKEEDRLNGIYQRAVQFMNGCAYDSAIALFQSIENYKDSQEKIKICRERKETARKDSIYRQAMDRVSVPANKLTDVDLKKSITELQTISGYKDVDHQIRTLNTRLEKWYEDKRQAEEAARIKAEEERRTQERLAEERRIKKEKQKAQAIKVAKVGIPTVIAIAAVVVLLITFIIPLIRYNQADELFNAGKYDEAMEIYQDIDGFSDSEQRIKVLYGINCIDVNDFKTGIEIILSAGVPVKLTYGMDGGDFSGTEYANAQDENDDRIVLANASGIPHVADPFFAPTNIPETVEFNYNSSTDFPGIQTPGRMGYRFVEWVLDSYSYQVDGIFELQLNAIWSEKEYTISYDLDGGAVATDNPIEYSIEDSSFTLTNPTKIGYTFIGWTGTDLSEPTTSVTIATGSAGNRNYKANWEANTYTVTLNANGGTVSTKSITVTYDQPYSLPTPEWTGRNFSGWYEGSKKVTSGTWTRTSNLDLTAQWDIVEYGITYNLNGGVNAQSNPSKYTILDEITLIVPTRTGYTFTGWTGTDLSEPTMVVVIDDCTGPRSYTATWRANTYTITLDGNGVALEDDSITVTYDKSYTLPTPTRTGYTFAGWYNGSTKYTGGTWKKTSDLKLTAKWNIITYNISYTMNGGTNPSSNPKTYDVEDIITLKQPTKAGYTFAGWIGTDISEPAITYTFGNLTGNRSYTATWTANTYTIALDANGGECSEDSITVTYDQPYTLPTPTRTGYTFEGWYGALAVMGDIIVEFTSGTWSLCEDVTLEAKWTANTYTVTYEDTADVYDHVVVTFDYNYSGSATAYTVTLTNGQTLGRPTDPTRSGYVFTGWYTDSSCTTRYEFTGIITKDMTLYAGWTEMSMVYVDSEVQIDPSDYASSSNYYAVSTSGTSAGYNKHIYLIAQESGTHYIYWKNSSSSSYYGYYLRIYNLTTGTTIRSSSNTYSTSYQSNSFTCSKGDVIVISLYRYNTSYSSTAYFYFSGFSSPTTSRAVASCATFTGFIYDAGSSYYADEIAFYDENYTLITPVRTGYTFGGWYNGDTKIESGIWNYTTDMTLTALWTANTYTVTYDAHGGECSIPSEEVIFDESYTLPTPTRVGYTFDGWFDIGLEYTGGIWQTAFDITLYAMWTPRTDITYVVNHYQQNIASDGYELYETQNFTGTADEAVTPAVKSYAGFTSPDAQTVSIAPDGSLVVDYYYTRNSYTVTMVTNGGEEIESITQKYQSALTMPDAVRDGYTFGGWFTDVSLTTEFAETTMPASNTTVYAWWTEENKASDFTYSGTSAIAINSYVGTSTTMWIPSYIGGTPVTTIPASAFASQTTLTEVVVPDTVTSIGNAAFKGCSSIESMTLPFVGTTEIASSDYTRVFGYIFGYATGYVGILTSNTSSYTTQGIYSSTSYYYGYYIPDTIREVTITKQTAIPANAFYNCDLIEEINIPTDTTSIGSDAFRNCQSLNKLNGKEIGEFNIPQSVTAIEKCTFYNCLEATKVTLSNSVTSIGAYAFSGCAAIVQFNSNNLCELIVPTSCTSIGEYAFKGLKIISNVVVPDTVTSIGRGAFEGCSSLESMTLPFVGEGENASSDDTRVFGHIFGCEAGCSSNTSSYTIQGIHSYTSYYYGYYIPDTIREVTITKQTAIPANAFYNCDLIEEINIPTDTTSIGSYAFYYCRSLNKLNGKEIGEFNIPQSVTSISSYAFYNCSAASNVTLTNSVTSIGAYAFSGCAAIVQFNSNNLGELIVPTSCTSIGAYAFEKLALITNVVVPDTVTSIGDGAFKGCSTLENITLPFVGDKRHDTESENKYPFGYIFGTSSYTGCVSTLQHYMTSRAGGGGNFYTTYKTYYIPQTLTQVTITDSNYIQYGAFENCNNIKGITIPDGVTAIQQRTFYNCTSLCRLNSTVDGEFNLPKGVKTIWDYAFYNCDGMVIFNCADGITSIRQEAFNGCNFLTQFNSENANELIVPDTVTTIGQYAFQNVSLVKNVVVPDSVTYIGIGAFSGCKSLESITIPFIGDSNKTTEDTNQYPLGYIFGSSSYTGGYGITQYYVGENINSYTSNTYYIPVSLKNVTVTNDLIISLGSFHNCSIIESITIPSTVTYIGNYAFSGCSKLNRLNSAIDGECNIPQNVTRIGQYIFKGCTNISKVTTGESIETIGYHAFYDCTALVQFNGDNVGEFVIPDTVTSIGAGAFYGSKMVSLTMPFVGISENNASATEITLGHIFGHNSSSSDQYLTSQNSEYTSQWASSTLSSKYRYYIPDTLRTVTITKQTNIPCAAFMNCDLIESITIPDNVESVGMYAFYNCKSLNKLNGTEIGEFNIPQSVTAIEKYTFYNCLEASKVTPSNDLTSIGDYAFAGCAAIVQFNSNNLGELIVPTSCTSIGAYAFDGLKIISNVVVPDTVTFIGRGAFEGCSSIKSITLPFVGQSENCTSSGCMTFGHIFNYNGDDTYDYLTSTSSYTSQYVSESSSYKYEHYIPKSIETVVITKQTSIPYAAFMNCDLIKSITLPDNTCSIGGYAFYNCKKLVSLNSSEVGEINIPSYVTAIEKYTFYNCVQMSDVSLSDNITVIDKYAFYGCSAIVKFNSSTLGEANIPASCERIGEQAFYGLTAITNLKVNDMVSTIGATAFGKMTSLQELTVPFIGNKNKTSANTYQYPLGYFFGTSSYTGGTSTTQYYYGSSTTSTTSNTYYIPTSLTTIIVTLGDLNYGAFYNCSKITSVTVNDNAVVNANALKNCSAVLSYASYTKPNYAWDGRTIATGYHSGSGTVNDPYIIANGDELAFFAQQVNAGVTYEGVYFKLSHNISLGSYEFGTIGTDTNYFKGVFDGNGHTISGLNINSSQQYVGLFSQTSGTIKNLGVSGTVTQTTEINLSSAGVLVGQLLEGGTISDCYTTGTLTSNSTYTVHCGGLVGYSKGEITNCYSSADVKATSSSLIAYAGGLVGYLEGHVVQSAAYGDVSAKGSTDSYSRNGGFVGYATDDAVMTNCYRSNLQVLTKYGVAKTSYNDLGTVGTMREILDFCKTNWDNTTWEFVAVYPQFK